MFISVVFHSPDMPRISPMVHLWWERPIAELIELIRASMSGDLPEDACAGFIGVCFGWPEVDTNRLSVSNIPYPPSWHDDSGDRFEWFRTLVGQIRTWQPAPVLVNLDPPFDITHGQNVLGRCSPRGG